ncbi:GHKL domain-containing protein [Allofournierella sp.]|uniref:GHKL domain-containing protein n=1 Tax=Allofournierella sp. TaxID=1940256 RepID=UPI003AB5A41F
MNKALLYSISLLLTDTPWYVVGCAPFMAHSRLKSRKSFLPLIIIGVGVVNAAAHYILISMVRDYERFFMPLYVAHTLLIIAMYLVAFRVGFAKLLYTFLLLQAVSTVVNQLAYVVLALLGVQTIGLSTTPSYTVAIVLGNALTIPFVWRFAKGRLRQAFADLPNRSILLLCVPPILFYFINIFYTDMVDRSDMRPTDIVVLHLLILTTGLATYYINLRTVMDNAGRVRLESEMESQLALQAQGYENLTQNIEAARIARHDLRHHMNVMEDYARRGDDAGLLAYLADYAKALPPDDTPDWCENRAVNVLLRHYLARAAKAGAALDIRIVLPARAGVPDTDLCVVFGNIFENAAKSVAAQRQGRAFLRARCDTDADNIILTVENSTDGEGPPHGEGVGLKSVEAVAKKHSGSAKFEQRDDAFFSAVILRTRRKAKGGGE